jgi:hypothetical protein
VARAVPDREHGEDFGQVLDHDLGAQLVEIEPLHQCRRERARAVEEEAAAIGGRRLGQEKSTMILPCGVSSAAKPAAPASSWRCRW